MTLGGGSGQRGTRSLPLQRPLTISDTQSVLRLWLRSSSRPFALARMAYFALLGLAACQVLVGETVLTTVSCQDEGTVGPPACAPGQVCLNGVCVSQSYAS